MLPGMMQAGFFGSAAAGGGSLFTLVGQKKAIVTNDAAATSLSLTDLTGGIAAAPAAGDLVLVGQSNPGGVDRDLTVTDGTNPYTEIADIWANSTHDTNLSLHYKVMTGTPDTAVTVDRTFFSGASNVVIIQVYRGQNATVQDVAATTANGTNTTNPNPASITPSTAGALIVVFAGGSCGTVQGGGVLSSSDMTGMLSEFASDSTYNTMAGMAVHDWTGGAFDPAAWTGGVSNSNNTWAAITAAIRPV